MAQQPNVVGYISEIAQTDANIEDSLLKAWLVFSDVDDDKKVANEDVLVISYLVNGDGCPLDELAQKLNARGIDKQSCDNAVARLIKSGHIFNNAGVIRLTKACEKNFAEARQTKKQNLGRLVDECIDAAGKNYGQLPNDRAQLQKNVKDCLLYYIRVNALSIFDVDNAKDFAAIKNKIEQTLSRNLSVDKKFIDFLIYEIGSMVERPTEFQRNMLKFLAKEFVVAQVLQRDPMLRDFKLTKLGGKEFILDTDLLLALVADYLPESKMFRRLIETLISAGCKIYCPMEVMMEVYDHAEAAARRYRMQGDPFRTFESGLNVVERNLFVEDFIHAYTPEERSDDNWKIFIENIYEKGNPNFTYEVIEQKLNSAIKINQWPCEISASDFDENLWQNLEEADFKVTSETERGKKRTPELNRRIAQTDTHLYLTAYARNQMDPDRNTRKAGILRHKSYVLTESTRIYQCGKNYGIEDKFLCNPRALLLYMSSAGLLREEPIDAIDLFNDNVLLECLDYLKEDVEKFVKCKISIKGKNGVRLHYDIVNQVESMICNIEKGDSAGVRDNITQITSLGYTFENEVEKMVDELNALRAENDQLKKQNVAISKANAKALYDSSYANNTFGLRKKKKKIK